MYYRTAESDEDYQHVRRLRNSVKAYMTNHRENITEETQIEFKSKNPLVYLYFTTLSSFVGYSLVTEKNGRYFGSLAVEEEFRGKGYGKYMYHHMQTYIFSTKNVSELWLDIYCDNNPSIIAALKAGFEFHSFRDGIMTFVAIRKK